MVLNNADNIMSGNSEVSRVYCGTVKVWERGGGGTLSAQDIAVLQYAATAYGDANGLPNLQYTDCYWFLAHYIQTGNDYQRHFYHAIAIPKSQYAPTLEDTDSNSCRFNYNIMQGYTGTVKKVMVRLNVYGSSDLWQITNASNNYYVYNIPEGGTSFVISDTYQYTNIPQQNITLQYDFPITRIDV